MSELRRRWWLLGCLACLTSCKEPHPEPLDERVQAPPEQPVERSWSEAEGLLVHGCDALYADMRCVLGKAGELRFWVPVLDARTLELYVDGEHGEPRELQDAAGGQRVVVQLARAESADGPASTRIELRAADSERAGRRWALEVDRSAPLSRDEGYFEAMQLAREGRQEQAVELLAAQRDRAAADGDGMRGRVAQLEAGISRIELSRARHEAALAATKRAHTAATAVGRVDLAAAAAARAVYLRTFVLPDYDEARAWLERLPEDPSAPSAGPYQRGLLALRLADLREAQRALDEAVDRARRLARPAYLRQALEVLAQVTAMLGQAARAEAYSAEVLELALADERRPCRQASAWANVGWAQTLLAGAGVRERAHEPEHALREALSLYTGACEDPGRAASVRLNLTYALLLAGQLDAVREVLDALEIGELKPWERSWVPLVEGRYALARGHGARAREWFEAAELEARIGDDQELSWRARVGLARVAAFAGQVDAALEHFEQAERMLERLASRVAIDAGRELFLAGREQATRSYIELALDAGQLERAACVARRALDRPQRMLELERSWAPGDERLAKLAEYRELRATLEDERERDWTVSRRARERLSHERAARIEALHELLDATFVGAPPPAPCDDTAAEPLGGEQAFELSMHSLEPREDGRTRWAVFWRGPGATWLAARVELSGSETPREQAERVLAPTWSAWPDTGSSSTLYLRLAPEAQAFDFERARVEGLALDEVFALAYEAGAALPGGEQPAATGTLRALIVADARGDLLHARREAARVEQALRARGWAVEVLRDEAVSARKLSQALAEVDLFHYAGHAQPAGIGGWDSGLVLGEGESFDVRDILALPRAPAFVILSGCETGAAPAAGPGPAHHAWTLAEAFVSAGAGSVIATRSIIADEQAAKMSAALIEQLDLDDGAGTLARARAALDEVTPASAWAEFRAWGRTTVATQSSTSPR